ncbi:AEC family transporter [Acinetobacter sp. S40]|uniref:AEC family transporter n=1 Tax=unclassified Acinetobacter TaxID=196816 RepID=UPI00190D3D75|nr:MULTISPECIES: AEC family transporter [unclassified Acinetobacter]MBJ9986294.1 AEC family transporter [Acinetobacter sp. S40]MBK0064359.1 AEC family transporter [Acinetobacter sp. S55]MBK0067834.1 AEC family transporter [Acinetobacter sp. S54]
MVVQVIVPIFLLLFAGFLSVSIRLISPDQIKALSAFIIKIALPAFLLYALSNKSLNDIWHPSYFVAYGGGSLIIFALAFYCYRYCFDHALTPTAVLAMGASMSNTGFIGTAVLSLLMGSHAAIYISLTLILENLLILALVLALAEAGQQEQQRIWPLLQKTAQNLLKNPVIIAIILGMGCILLDLQLPALVDQSLALLGKTASPLALFVIGGSLVGMGMTAVNLQSGLLVAFKVILMPLLIYSLLRVLPDVSQEMLYAGTILAALPMPIAFGIFGQAYGLNERALTPLMLSTILGFVGVSGLIVLWW